jgi:hypothetical protein
MDRNVGQSTVDNGQGSSPELTLGGGSGCQTSPREFLEREGIVWSLTEGRVRWQEFGTGPAMSLKSGGG